MKINKICCIGAGYVGGPTMAVISQKCPDIQVVVVDKNPEKIAAWNSKNLDLLPVYEPGLKEIVSERRDKNLIFSTNIKQAIKDAEMIFMAVNTPTKTEGAGAGMAANLTYIEACAREIADVATTDKIVVEKSTLPVRTAEKIKEILETNTKGAHFEVLSNPEFLAEGTAIQDLYKSDRVLIGGDNTKMGKKAINSLVEIYKRWIPEEKILTTNVWSSELSKLASNAMLAQRISSINSLSALCEKTGANIGEVAKAIGMDQRIGPHFLKTSVGFGGSCFQKDILNLVYLCKHYGLDEVADYWYQVVKINDHQKERFAQKIIDYFNGDLAQKKIALLGWAFKANTNDTRESPAIYVAADLLVAGGTLHVFDPLVPSGRILDDLAEIIGERVSTEETKILLNKCNIYTNLDDALNQTHCAAILTEWDMFKENDAFDKIASKNSAYYFFDGRAIMKDKYINKYEIGFGKAF